MKGTYNNQNRKSGGYPKTKITVGKKVGGQSLPCDEQRHSDCDGYLTFFPHLKGYACQCDCHKKAKVTTKVEPTVGKFNGTPTNYGATTLKPEPTVEKWEKLGSLGLSETQKEAISYMHYNSLQEAKAERDEEWKKIIACHNCNGTGRTDNIGGAMECIECGGQCHNLVRFDGIHIDDLLSTLNTKSLEEKV